LISLTLKAQVHSVAQIGHFTGNLSKRSVMGYFCRYEPYPVRGAFAAVAFGISGAFILQSPDA
jgi:hypothetical protein